ncbi:amidohydrolase [Paenibacillus radicis (ex Gao et al. 2016)]|uniref:Glutamate carboxypeptidase n=1 Tax=Paenibacillus radicis (ex Gao et al. 2016) TaxID=1737354 RepID=A0A917M1Z3_9BACL|nr:amidohydrolase [Paenibacillus radicis (ex Gao et al. 2016)]GGG72313.1 glutamate carboxypeptidase [Paenibacillus radicis (ex Gao et al. 2016)]
MGKNHLAAWLDEHKESFEELARQIWERPEIAYTESFASNLQIQTLRDAGFTIESGVGGVPTAFVAEYGSGKPVIGLLGEYDALPGLSQKVSAVKEAVTPNGPGHGCGHNLLGTAGVAAAIALKHGIDSEGLAGTIRYYGCPAEEVLSGKTFMARAGVFDGLDAALTWHPGTSNATWSTPTSALTSIQFNFEGKAAHAGAAPHLGRSALDAVELMNVGANYLREHVPDGSRIHYTITNGGEAPNIVPAEAGVWYYLRGANRAQVDELLERLLKIAQGAALMTETAVTWEIKAGAYGLNVNHALNQLLSDQHEQAGPLVFTEEDQRLAASLAATLEPAVRQLSERFRQEQGLEGTDLLPTAFINPRPVAGRTGGGSTDVGDVSWITPVGQITTTCAPFGVQVHTWQATASFGSAIGLKGMQHAAKLLALAAYELLTDGGEQLRLARHEFTRSTEGKPYVPAIPPEVQAPVPV